MIRITQITCWIAVMLTVSSGVALGQKLNDPSIPSRKGTVRMYSNPKIKESSIDWKSTRLEFIAGGGATGFLGDLGGQNTPGKPFIFDYEPTTTRYSVSAGARYFLREFQAVRGYLTYAEVQGSDELTEYPNRKYRNLNFKSPIVELGHLRASLVQAELHSFCGRQHHQAIRRKPLWFVLKPWGRHVLLQPERKAGNAILQPASTAYRRARIRRRPFEIQEHCCQYSYGGRGIHAPQS